MTEKIHYAETVFGFEYGAAKVERMHHDAKKGWVVLLLSTPMNRNGRALDIYVTKTGKVRIHDERGEWQAPKTTKDKSND